MKNISIWNDIKRDNYPKLNENKEVDILIIGGGITGISTLYHLRNSNLKVMLVEQNKIGYGTTGNSTGKLNYLQNDLIDKIRNYYNDDIARKYLNSQKETIKNIVDTIKKEDINCDLEKVYAYLYTNKTSEIDKIKNLEKFLIKNKINVYKDNIDIVKSKYMIKVDNTYIFHPIKFLYGLIKKNKYPIYENTSIKKIKKKDEYYICYTDSNKIKAKTVILASHYPYFVVPFLFPFKVNLEKSYLSASKYKSNPLSLISYSNPFISIRTHKDYLIYLSNSHSINSKVCDRKNFNELLKKLNDIKLKPEYLWSNIDIMTSDYLPMIGKLDDNLLIGTGYNTWGLTNGFLAGEILSDIILNNKNKYIKLFNPKRLDLKHVIPYLNNICKNIDGYIKGYTDKSKTEYKCPHLGCKLIYNEIEKTYDCPCHGSRFSNNGKCINAPANKDIF